MIDTLLTNWRTTLTGVIVIALGALNTFAGVHVPGFTLDFGAAVVIGVGMILGRDAAAKPSA